jgi:hypothetical protein
LSCLTGTIANLQSAIQVERAGAHYKAVN